MESKIGFSFRQWISGRFKPKALQEPALLAVSRQVAKDLKSREFVEAQKAMWEMQNWTKELQDSINLRYKDIEAARRVDEDWIVELQTDRMESELKEQLALLQNLREAVIKIAYQDDERLRLAIRKARESKGLSVVQLARELGLASKTIERVEENALGSCNELRRRLMSFLDLDEQAILDSDCRGATLAK